MFVSGLGGLEFVYSDRVWRMYLGLYVVTGLHFIYEYSIPTVRGFKENR